RPQYHPHRLGCGNKGKGSEEQPSRCYRIRSVGSAKSRSQQHQHHRPSNSVDRGKPARSDSSEARSRTTARLQEQAQTRQTATAPGIQNRMTTIFNRLSKSRPAEPKIEQPPNHPQILLDRSEE